MPVTLSRMMTVWLLLAPVPALADDGGGDGVLFNQVHLEATAERELDNDLLEVTLAVEVQGSEPARIVRRVNEAMEWALEQAGSRPDLEVQTQAYRTYPVYRDQVVIAWRASQQLLLRSRRITELSELTGTLQERLQVKSMRFSTSTAARREVENALIGEAMTAFRERVDAVGQHMQGMDYRIVNLHIDTGQPGPVMYQERAMAMSDMDAGGTPAVAAGTSRVTVRVSGSVQFY